MSRQLPPADLVPFFTRALKTFQLSKTTFSVLCTISPPSSSSSPSPASSAEIAAGNEPVARPPRQVPQTLLVLDSSFNPPTLAHQRMALSALREERYNGRSRVLLLLAINNADKAPKPASFPQRLAMMYIFALDLVSALTGQKTDDSTAETTTSGTGPEVDLAVITEPYFHSKSNAIAASDFYAGSGEKGDGMMEQVYLTGFDTLIRIFDPKYYPDNTIKQALDPFFAHSALLVTMRTDADWGGADEQRAYLEDLRSGKLLAEAGGSQDWADKVELVEGNRRTGEEIISSTKVRDAVQGQDWARLREYVSGDVADWVRREGLYREDST